MDESTKKKQKQINLTLPTSLLDSAQNYIEAFGYKNIQDLAAEAIREKIFHLREHAEHQSQEESTESDVKNPKKRHYIL